MRRGTLYVLLSAFLWGTTFPAIRFGLEEGGLRPYSFVFERFLLAAFAILAIAAWRRRLDIALFRDFRVLALSCVNAAGYLLQFLAQDLTTASKTALLVNVNVLLTALLAFIILGERIAATTKWGVGLGAIGVALLTTNGDLSAIRFSNHQFVGDLLAFGTGCCWTVYILGLKAYLTRRPETDAVSMNAVLFIVTSLLLGPLAWWHDGLAFTGNTRGAALLVYIAFLPTTGAFLLYQKGLQSMSAAVSSIMLLLENVVAISISVVAFQETFSAWAAAGAALILVATYLASRAPAPRPSRPDDPTPTSASP